MVVVLICSIDSLSRSTSAGAALLITRSKDRSSAYVQFSILTFLGIVLAVPLRTLPLLGVLSPIEVYPRLFFGLGSGALPAAVFAVLGILALKLAARSYGLRTG